MTPHLEENLTKLFALLSKAAARQKVYARKAQQDGRPDLSHLLRVLSASETVQARRILKTLRGKVDTTEKYLATIFEQELPLLLEEYSRNMQIASDAGSIPMNHALTQMRAASRRLQSFYSTDKHELRHEDDRQYYLCQFCGYVNETSPPETCPICGAKREGFQEVF
jgi:rubrerythrin